MYYMSARLKGAWPFFIRSLAFTLLASTISFRFALISGCVLFASLILPKRKLELIAIANLVGLLITYKAVMEPRQSIETSMLLVVIVVSFYFAVAYFTIMWQRIFVAYMPIFICLLGVFFHSELNWFLRGFLALTIHSLWHNMFFLRSLRHRKSFTMTDFLCSQHGFYSSSFVPIPAYLPQSVKESDQTDSAVLKLQNSALLFIFICAIVTFIREKVGLLCVSNIVCNASLSYNEITSGGLAPYQSIDFTRAEKWAIAVGSFTGHCFYILVYQGFAVSVVRMLGVNANSPITNFLRAQTFYQFLEHLNHYYARIVLEIFIYPFFNLFKNIKKDFLYPISFSIGIFCCGIFYHLFARYVYPSGIAPNISNFLPATPYWLLIGIGVFVSIKFERFASRTPGILYQVGRIFTYLCFQIVIFLFVKDFETSAISIEWKWNFFKSLFGL